jgi:hypothetical protein
MSKVLESDDDGDAGADANTPRLKIVHELDRSQRWTCITCNQPCAAYDLEYENAPNKSLCEFCMELYKPGWKDIRQKITGPSDSDGLDDYGSSSSSDDDDATHAVEEMKREAKKKEKEKTTTKPRRSHRPKRRVPLYKLNQLVNYKKKNGVQVDARIVLVENEDDDGICYTVLLSDGMTNELADESQLSEKKPERKSMGDKKENLTKLRLKLDKRKKMQEKKSKPSDDDEDDDYESLSKRFYQPINHAPKNAHYYDTIKFVGPKGLDDYTNLKVQDVACAVCDVCKVVVPYSHGYYKGIKKHYVENHAKGEDKNAPAALRAAAGKRKSVGPKKPVITNKQTKSKASTNVSDPVRSEEVIRMEKMLHQEVLSRKELEEQLEKEKSNALKKAEETKKELEAMKKTMQELFKWKATEGKSDGSSELKATRSHGSPKRRDRSSSESSSTSSSSSSESDRRPRKKKSKKKKKKKKRKKSSRHRRRSRSRSSSSSHRSSSRSHRRHRSGSRSRSDERHRSDRPRGRSRSRSYERSYDYRRSTAAASASSHVAGPPPPPPPPPPRAYGAEDRYDRRGYDGAYDDRDYDRYGRRGYDDHRRHSY